MMKNFFSGKNRSAGYARDRMKLLRNDLIHTVKKYVVIDETKVAIQIRQDPPVMYATIPVLKKRDV